MVERKFWLEQLETAWARKSVVWLAGLRRVGKTTLAQSLPKAEYFDCELPSVRRLLTDPESFLRSVHNKRIVLDEVHRLENPSQVLKIAADHFPKLKVLATGSSTLGASRKFKDTLTGRKEQVWLTPMVSADLVAFGDTSFDRRFQRGGLPPFFLAGQFPERDFQEWIDSFWAKDIQELFRLERRSSFQKFFEMLMVQSGSLFEATRFAAPCEVSRPTIANYLSVLSDTFAAHIVRPFTSRRTAEIVSAPKVYAMDTGFISYHRGWHQLRADDMGVLWEHFVLNELQANLQLRSVNFWRDKTGHEIDFVISRRGAHPVTIECKWNSSQYDDRNLQVFRRAYPKGRNFVVCADVTRSYSRIEHLIQVEFVSLQKLITELSAAKS